MANFITRHFNFLSNKKSAKELESVIGSLGEKVAYKALAIYIATSYIANAISKCKINVIINGKEEQDYLSWRLNVSPNNNQSGAQFINELVTRICLDSEALVVSPKEDELFVASGFSRDPRPMKDDLFQSVSVSERTIKKRFKASEVFYFKLENRNPRRLVSDMYDDYGKLVAASIESFVQSKGRKYKLKLDQVKAGDPEFADTWENLVKKQLEEFLKSPSAVYPEYQGYSLEEMKHENDGDCSDIISMRKEIFDIAAQTYKIPTSMMYGNTNNTAEVVKQFLTFAVDPIAQMIGDEFTRKSFTFEQWQKGCRVVVDTKTITHVDIFDVSDKVDKLISSGVFSIDTVLSTLGYQPLNTEFSKAHFITKNYELAEDALKRLSGGGDKE